MQIDHGIYLIAGEVSGEAIGAKLMIELKKLIPNTKFHGIGGSAMEAHGLSSLFKYDRINLMGFVEVLPHIFRLRKLIKQTANDIIEKNPQVLVTIDSPGFCYRVAKLVKQTRPDMKMIHIVAPSVWAYKPGRAAKFASIYNHMLALLPFEPPYFEAVGLPTTYIGHPVFDQEFGGGEEFRRRHEIADDAKLIVVTPGSRRGEIARHLPLFLEALKGVRKQYKELIAVIVYADKRLLPDLLPAKDYITIGSEEKLAAYAAADAALAKSGTNTLEIAASGTPMIVAYKMNFFTYWAVKLMAKIKYASLINIIADKEIIPEFLQHKATAENLTAELLKILGSSKVAKQQVEESMKSLKKMGFGSKSKPAELAAKVIVECL